VIGGPTEQNLIDFYTDGGIIFSGMFPHRPDDILAAGFAYTGISNQVHGLDGSQGLPSDRNRGAFRDLLHGAA